MIAHVSGLPIEETVAQLAPAGVAVLIALRAARETFRAAASSRRDLVPDRLQPERRRRGRGDEIEPD